MNKLKNSAGKRENDENFFPGSLGLSIFNICIGELNKIGTITGDNYQFFIDNGINIDTDGAVSLEDLYLISKLLVPVKSAKFLAYGRKKSKNYYTR
jgi:hypothetical protein